MHLSGGTDARVDLAVDPDLDPGAPALDGHDEVDALVQDGDVPRRVAPSSLPWLAAVTVIDQRPAVSSNGVRTCRRRRRRPSTAAERRATGWPRPTRARAARGGRRTCRRLARRPARTGPRYVALTTTVLAFVVVPATGIAPFSNVAPSAAGRRSGSGPGRLEERHRDEELRRVCPYRLPVSGSVAVMSNWLRPRRRSTSADHCPSGSAVTWTGSRPGRGDRDRRAGSDVPRSV